MKIGLLSDAHGNAKALLACVEKLEAFRVDGIYFLGDAVGYLPGENEVIEILRAEGVRCQKGNHEAMLLGELSFPHSKERIYQIESARSRLSKVDRQFIESWPDHRMLEVNGKKLLLVHGSPHNHLQGYVYPNDAFSGFDALPYHAIFMGHTHYPFAVQRQGMLLGNVGSCGLPRDEGDLLAFGIYDGASHHCEIYRFRFDSKSLFETAGPSAIAEEVFQVFSRKSSVVPFGRQIDGKL